MLQLMSNVVIALIVATLIGAARSMRVHRRLGQSQGTSLFRANDPAERRRWFRMGFNFGLLSGRELASKDAIGGEARLEAERCASRGAVLQLAVIIVVSIIVAGMS